MNLENSSIIRW